MQRQINILVFVKQRDEKLKSESEIKILIEGREIGDMNFTWEITLM